MSQNLRDLDDRPVSTLIERVVAEHPSTWATKAELTGFSDRQLRRWRKKEWQSTPMWAGDRILSALGTSDPTARYLTSVGLARFVGCGTHEFLEGLLQKALPAVVEAERAGVRMRREQGEHAAEALEARLSAAIAIANNVMD